MKARREHQVPLSGRSIEVLRQAEELADGSGALVFPGLRGKPSRRKKAQLGVPQAITATAHKLVSDMVFTAMLRRLEIPAVARGFRSSFKDWCIECTSASWELGETALAHNLGNSTEHAYARTDLFEQRRRFMDQWADFVGYGNKQIGMPGI